MTGKTLGPLGIKALENRRLNPETAARLGVYTAERNEAGQTVPSENGNIIVFPFVEGDIVVNEKFRGRDKKFWQTSGGKKTFFNANALDDPSLYDGKMALTITEGELDCMTAIDCGFPLSVSVPDGAPPPLKPGEPLEPIDPATEATGKYEYLFNNRERLKRVKRFIIAVDSDAPGKRLADELVRRLSASRCSFVTYPDGCKDLNDVLMKHGPEATAGVLNGAQPYPIKGVYALNDYADKPQIETFLTGWSTLDGLFQMFFPSFIVVTGIPSHGKSSLITHLLVNMARLHGFKSAIFSPEMPVVPHLRDKIRRIASGAAIDHLSNDQIANVDRWISANLFFIDHDTTSDDDEDITLEWVMERAVDAVVRHGIRILVIDPWNEVEHAKEPRESTTEYINRAVRKLKKFGLRYGLCIIVIAHPTKDIQFQGKVRVPTAYDIDGSAAWANKPDIVMTIHRPSPTEDKTHISIGKVRFEGTGEKGLVVMKFNRENSRYELLDPGPDYGQQEMR